MELVAVLLGIVIVSIAIFGGLVPTSYMIYPIEFVTIPLLVWIAFRFGPLEAATALAVEAAIAIRGTVLHFGPFVMPTTNESLLVLQSFMAVSAIMTLVLASAELDRRRVEAMARDTERRLRLMESESRQSEARRADEAEAARDQTRDFMGMVVHDLRGPLTVTAGYTQLLRRQLVEARDAPQAQRLLDKIETSVQTMRRLVNDLLDSTRIGRGRFVVNPVDTDLVQTVRQVVDEQRDVAPDHQFEVRAPGRLAGVWDSERVRQVTTNLISNAVKYSPAGTHVRVTLREVGQAVRLSVADEGVGIAPDQIGHLFEPFSRLGREQEATGTGLGLYISKGIVEAHGGRIWVESAVNQGSTFYVELPSQLTAHTESGQAGPTQAQAQR
jgi:signal transduction histidine kinase